MLADDSTYAVTRMSAFASFMRHAPSAPSTQRAGCGRPTRATDKSDVIVAGLGASTVVSFSSSREPTGARVDTPALCARPVTVRPDLPPTRVCRPSDKTCLMFNVQPPWRRCRYSPTRSSDGHHHPSAAPGGREAQDRLQSINLCGPVAKALADMVRQDRCRAGQTGTAGASRRQVAGSAHKNFWRYRDR